MDCTASVEQQTPAQSSAKNLHTVNPDIKVHTVVSEALDYDHKAALLVPLGEVTDEQLLAEVCMDKVFLSG